MMPETLPAAATQESPVRRTVGASAIAAINLVVKIGSNFIIIPLALRFLGREEYAIWIILQSIAVYLTMSELGIGQSLLNFQNVAFAKGDHEEVNRVLTTGFGLSCLFVIPVWVAFVIILLTQPVASWLLKDVPPGSAAAFEWYLFLAGTLALLRVPLSVLPTTLMGLRETVLRQLIDGAYALFLLVGTVLTLVLDGKLLALILVTNLGFIFIMLLSYPLAQSRHPEVRLARRFWTPALIRLLLANSSFFFLYNLGLFFQRLAGNLLAGMLGPLRQVPEMFVLLTLFRVVGWSLADIASQTLQPYIIRWAVQGAHERVVFFAKLCTKFTVTVAVVYSALIWVFADIGLRLWLGPGMFLGYGHLACLGGAFLMEVLFLSTNNFMRALNRHRRLSFVMAGYAVLSFVLGIVGAKRWIPADPLLGLCVGLLVASVVGQAFLIPWFTCRWLEIGWRSYLRQFITRPGFLAAGAIAILFVFTTAGADAPWNRATGTLAVVVGLPLLAWFLVLDDEERAWMRSLMGNFRLLTGAD
jgi:O-antigen/teichoic acid export membrane protein